eukprot:scaffold894_cov260-Alexandrium_tamarense.AAC.2
MKQQQGMDSYQLKPTVTWSKVQKIRRQGGCDGHHSESTGSTAARGGGFVHEPRPRRGGRRVCG